MQRTDSAPCAQPTSPAREPKLEGAFATLDPDLRQALFKTGYTTPTCIQEQSIPHLLAGRDLIGSAQTGTGKTAAFALPLLQRLSRDSRPPRRGTPRALILAPTRELAAQIGDSIRTYGRFLRLRHTTIFGGVSQYGQVKDLNRGVDIVVATPGRLLDLMQQGHLRLDGVETFILDEVDRMLDMGFLPDIRRVVDRIPATRQTLFFSATMPVAIEELARSLVKDPARITIAPEHPAVERIAQKVLFVDKGRKLSLLGDLLAGPELGKVIVFTQMKHVANRVAEKLDRAGIPTTAIHGNKSQAARSRALAGFKQGRYRVLVATDVAARGIDIDDITHVINYDLPVEPETYVHRIGRTGRAGADGDAISFCTAEDRAVLGQIEQVLGQPVEPDLDHAFHCERAFLSTAPAPRLPGRGGRGPGGPGGSRRGKSRRKKPGTYAAHGQARNRHRGRRSSSNRPG